jgi:cell division protein FtsL
MKIKELKSYKRKIKTDIENMQAKHATLKTNHILHLLLSIFTAGFWIIIWIIVDHFDVRGRITLEKKIKESRAILNDIEDQIDELE